MLGGVYWLGVSANTNSVPIVVLTVSADGWPIPKEDIFSMVKNEFSGLQVGDLLYLCRVGSLVGAVFEVQVIKAKTLQVVCLENGNEHIMQHEAAFLYGLRRQVPDSFAALATKRVLLKSGDASENGIVSNVSSGS